MLSPIANYTAWNTNRSGSDKGGGGLTLLYRDSLTAHQYSPNVPSHLQYIMNERQWLLVSNNKEKVAFLHVYIACQSNRSEAFLGWNEDLFFLIAQEAKKLKQQGFIVLAMGDFNSRVGSLKGLEENTPDINRNSPMFFNFLQETNLLIINTLPLAKGLFTRFMDTSGRPGSMSLLDYGLIDHNSANTVTSFVIDEEARYEAGTDHALLECILEFGSRPKVKWNFQDAIHYNITDSSSYTDYQNHLDLETASIPLNKFAELPVTEMLPHISESINKSAKRSFGLKVKKHKQGQKLPKEIISLIRSKNDLKHKLVTAQTSITTPESEAMQQELENMKAQIKESLSMHKLHRRSRLRSKLLLADPTRKKFWRFLKSQTKRAGHITALSNQAGSMVFEQHEIEDTVLHNFGNIFVGQRIPVFPLDRVPDQVSLSIAELDQILGENTPSFAPDHFEEKVCAPYTFVELNDILGQLPSNKASGYDSIPNELLKNCSTRFKHYLLIFLNKILEDGIVPQNLNSGKCMLIHKVKPNTNTPKYLSLFLLQGGDSLQPSNYRPITVPSNLLRLITKRMCNRMSRAAEENLMLGPEQFGFRQGRSTLDAAFVLSTLMRKAKNKR